MIDPVSEALIAAIVAGTTAGLSDVSKTTLVESYTALKTAIQKRFGQQHTLVKAIEAIETEPTSQEQQNILIKKVTEAQANKDAELLKLAENIHRVVKEHTKVNIIIQNNASIQAQNIGNYQQITQQFGNLPKS